MPTKCSITYGDRSAEMGTPEAEKLIAEILAASGKTGISIRIPQVYLRDTKIKEEKALGLVMLVEVAAKLDIPTVARLLHLRQQGYPLFLEIGSPQAHMDLLVRDFNTETGEVKAPAVAAAGGAR